MNDFNRRYDFDRTRRRKNGNRLRALLITILVAAVTGAIIYFIIPHGGAKTGNDRQKPATDAQAKPAAPGGEEIKTPPPEKPGDAPAVGTAAGTDPAERSAEVPAVPAAPDAPDAPAGDPSAATPPAGADAPAVKDAPAAGADEDDGVADPLSRAITVTVRAGDSLGAIAKRHHTTVESIRYFNRLKNYTIRVGQKLRVVPGPWRITVDKAACKLVLEHSPNGKRQLFRKFPADAAGMKDIPRAGLVVSFMRKNPEWVSADGSKFKHGDPGNPLGDYQLRLAPAPTPLRPWHGNGIHGVNDKSAVLPVCGRGCIHVSHDDVKLLYHLVCPGTPVDILSGAAVKNSEK